MLIVFRLTTGCDGTKIPEDTENFSGFKYISGEEAKELFDSNDPVVLLDVRNRDEYEENHITGSILIPVDELEERLSELPDKNTTIIVYCAAGRRSAAAVDILVSNGYTNIYNMQSINNWP